MNKQTLDRLISSYTKWKSWSLDVPPTYQYSVYSEEIARAKLPSSAHILEIGFGEGTFLDWARDQGFQCTGLEINPELVTAAQVRGHVVYQGNLGSAFPSDQGLFHAVVLFDVLEHICIEDILSLFDDLHRLLKPNGKIIARFPNGASPFGRAYQYGDATHVTVLSGNSIAQIGLAAGFDIIGQYNAARGTKSRAGGFRNNWFVRRTAFLLRDITQAILSRIYFGKNIPMDPNVTIILEKIRS